MSDKPLLVQETPVWIKPLTGTPMEICDAVRQDLLRAQRLVGEAVDVLSDALPRLVRDSDPAGGSEPLKDAVRSLQFGDMVNQLLEASEQSLERLALFMAQARKTVPREAGRCSPVGLRAWSTELSEYKDTHCHPHSGAVDQDDLEIGEIELF